MPPPSSPTSTSKASNWYPSERVSTSRRIQKTSASLVYSKAEERPRIAASALLKLADWYGQRSPSSQGGALCPPLRPSIFPPALTTPAASAEAGRAVAGAAAAPPPSPPEHAGSTRGVASVPHAN